jgi:hypothetical protein
MPSVSKKQHNLMAAVAHNPKFAKKVGIPQSVGKEFNKADKGKQFKRGGEMGIKNTNGSFDGLKASDVENMHKRNAEKKRAAVAAKKSAAKPGMGMFGTGARKAAAPAAKPAPKLAKSDPGLKKSLSFARDITRGKPAARQEAKVEAANKKAVEAYKKYKPNPNQANKPAPAAKPAAPPMGEPVAKMDPGRTPMGAGAKAFAPAIKKAKGGKVCGMKAGGVNKELPTAKDLGSMNMKKGGRVKCMAGGGYVRAADGVTKKGKTKGKII